MEDVSTILTLRHGESLGNFNQAHYLEFQDHGVPLTERGWQQAVGAGKAARAFAKANGIEQFRIWYSPYKRTVQTKNGFIEGLGTDLVERVFEDERLREQEFGLFSDIHDPKEQAAKFPEEYAKYKRMKDANGRAYARFPHGESRIDTVFRTRQFTETLMRDNREGVKNVILISHGVTVRAFEMGFLHLGVEWLEHSKNPHNCQIKRIFGSRTLGWKAETIFKGFPERGKKDQTLSTPRP